ncbi:hypothetical protein AMS66_25045 [Paenibacillus xylanivorans]|uniref:Uncharacterized protein n=1 Tax=Paenibacillus xylanivorans TaxID=1705561 RepID=A0A0M9BJM6_9BACL|nr:hypothetical protein AMS66_25045 [Paenibacillus xylanivorans]
MHYEQVINHFYGESKRELTCAGQLLFRYPVNTSAQDNEADGAHRRASLLGRISDKDHIE